MRIKAKGIAKELGLSEATVSLALNDRPGVKIPKSGSWNVSEKSRKNYRKILKYRKRLFMEK